MNQEKLYTEQELKLKILENNQSHLFDSIKRLDEHVGNLDNKFDTFKYWVLGLMIVQFGLILTSLFLK